MDLDKSVVETFKGPSGNFVIDITTNYTNILHIFQTLFS